MENVHGAVRSHAPGMSRREFIGLLGGAVLSGCAGAQPGALVPATGQAGSAGPATGPGLPLRVRAVAFDLFTLFDPRGVDQRVQALLGEHPAFGTTWKRTLFAYSWIRAAAGQYRDFEALVQDSLTYAARAESVALDDRTRAGLAAAFTELEPWPDTRAVLERLRGRGLRLAPLANFAPRMIERLLGRAGLLEQFDVLISTDQARTYKPDPRAYALGESVFGLPRREIAFSAFGSWDAAGARWFGFPTFWVNRLGQASEELVAPDATGADLEALSRWLSKQ